MDEILNKDAVGLIQFIYKVGPEDYKGYYSITMLAAEAIRHLVVSVENLQNKVESLEDSVKYLESTKGYNTYEQ